MLGKLLYKGVEIVAYFHHLIMGLNDAYEYNFTDKELHFIIIGMIGMIGIFVIYPLFKWLAETGHVMVISWIYVFTMIVVLTFAIEIGQKITGTGAMEFADIASGMMGFLVMFFVFSTIRWIWHLIIDLIRNWKND